MHRHQRTSSSGSRSFKETLNAFTADGHDGTRSVNQYILKERLGQGSYATVERATDRVTHVDYVRSGPTPERPLPTLTAPLPFQRPSKSSQKPG